jgi:hypothetical protein
MKYTNLVGYMVKILKRNNTELGRFSEMVTENYLFQTADMWFEAGKKEGSRPYL